MMIKINSNFNNKINEFTSEYISKQIEQINIIGNYTDKIASVGTKFNIEKNNGSSLGVWTYNDDRTINGTKFFDDVYPSKKNNEIYSDSIAKLSCGECPDI